MPCMLDGGTGLLGDVVHKETRADWFVYRAIVWHWATCSSNRKFTFDLLCKVINDEQKRSPLSPARQLPSSDAVNNMDLITE